MKAKELRRRVIISGVVPQVDDGRYPVKRIVGDQVEVFADVFVDGHDLVAGELLYRAGKSKKWVAIPLESLGNDRHRASFGVNETGTWRFTVKAWVDRFKSWQRDLQMRVQAGQNVGTDLVIGSGLITAAAKRARGADAKARSSAPGRTDPPRPGTTGR